MKKRVFKKSKKNEKEIRAVKAKARVYIDGANIFYTQKSLGWFVDWKKVVNYLESHYEILGIKYYTGIKIGDEKMQKFLKYLDAIGITPVTKTLKRIKDDDKFFFKSNFDVEMTTDILLERKGVDELILFSGDSDFHNLVVKLKDFGIKVTVFSTRKMISWELKLSASRYIFLEDIKKYIVRKNLRPKAE